MNRKGFTLVELTLGVVLTAIVALMLPPLLMQGVNAYVLATNRTRLLHDARHTIQRMTRELLTVRQSDIRLIQPNRCIFVDANGGPADYGFIAAGTRGTIYRTAVPILNNVNDLTFRYFDTQGVPTTRIPNLRRIEITLTANALLGGTITMRTEVFPRKVVYNNFD